MLYANQIASKKHSIGYELYFKTYLIADGSSGQNRRQKELNSGA